MLRPSVLIASACVVLAATAAAQDAAQDAALLADSARFMSQWCTSCHGGEKPKASLDLAAFPAAFAAPDTALRKVALRLRNGTMPPAKAPQPPRDDVAHLLGRVDAAFAAESRPTPGRVGIRRLSRYEYSCSIRDLLGVDVPLEEFPVDDAGYGFDNVADVLGVSPLLFEKYAAAAERVAAEALPADDPASPRRTRALGSELFTTLKNSVRGSKRMLYVEGEATLELALPRTGDYVLRARVFGEQAGPDLPRMRLAVDRGAGGVRPTFEANIEGTKTGPVEHELRMRLVRGSHMFSVGYMNDFFDPKIEDASKRDRNLVVEWVEVVGPVDRIEPSAPYRQIFAADPGGADAGARLRAILAPFVLRAWRRPATEDELRRLVELGQSAIERDGRLEHAVQLGVRAALVSPHFLFRIEADPAGAASGASRDLSGFELASRLAYFLWSSVPDAKLLEIAAAGRLAEIDSLRAETARMLADAKASALAESFAAQWLELRNLVDAAPDPVRFPEFDEELRSSMRRETEMLFEAVLRERRPVRELLEADFTFVNERLARHYGIPGIRGAAFRRVPAPPDRGGGFLAHASVLTVTSNATRTSPVRRGKFVLDNVLDEPPPAPPPGLGALDERPDAARDTMRERMEKHRTQASCAACHARIDPIGFALERFDPVGVSRLQDEGGAAVDASAVLPDGRKLQGLPGLRQAIREEGALVRCLSKKLFVYALGRGVDPSDEQAILAMIARLPADPTIADVIMGIVDLEAFRRRAL